MGDPQHPDLLWARSGAMQLTGWPDRAPQLVPAPLALRMEEWMASLRSDCGDRAALRIDAGALLGERAAALELQRAGNRSASGSCRLLAARDGWLALNLARADDLRLLPAWLESEIGIDDAWNAIAAAALQRDVSELVARGRLLGLAIAPATAPPTDPRDGERSARLGKRRTPLDQPPLVLDLSSLWAGPLCTHLLQLAGARVLKLESTSRPDAARTGPRDFFDLLNADKESIALDLRTRAGVSALLRLIAHADLVVESARPRALAQLGVSAETMLASHPGLTWLSITGYGRREPERNWVAFGDDAAVGAGLALACGDAERGPIFCGDAIADPLTGMRAACEAMRAMRDGGGWLLDCSLRGTVSSVLADARRFEAASVTRDPQLGWCVASGDLRERVAAPRMRQARDRARDFGADTPRVLREFGEC